MMLALIFSKDRALQLEACITSLFRHGTEIQGLRIQVIYDGSSARYLTQYEELARALPSNVVLVRETNFRESVLTYLRQAARIDLLRPKTTDSARASTRSATNAASQGHVLFLVDDTVFVREIRLEAFLQALTRHPNALGISLRLGSNTVQSYPMARQQRLPKFRTVGAGLLSFDWTTADGDFGYPLELSSSIYRLSDLLPVLIALKFQDPNTLESKLSLAAHQFSRKMPAMLCPQTSIAFSIPINRVQTVFENRVGKDPRWSTEQLADKFDQGIRIDVAKLDGFTPSACHQEVELQLEARA